MSHRIVDVASFEGRRKPVGRTLEVRAFGINQFDSSPGQAGFEHDEAESGQEEVYVALAGSGEIRIGSESVPLAPGATCWCHRRQAAGDRRQRGSVVPRGRRRSARPDRGYSVEYLGCAFSPRMWATAWLAASAASEKPTVISVILPS